MTCTLAALAAGVAGCAAPSGSSVTVSGTSLTVYASAPSLPDDPQLRSDVLAAEQLAFQQGGGSQFGRFTVKLVTLGAKPSDNARKAIQDTTAIAYLGEIEPGDSDNSLGITNAQDLLQVSPTDTALELTQSSAAVSGSPQSYYESLKSYGRTFARVVPSTALEAKAQAQEMEALGVKRLFVSDDGGAYGKAIALAVKQDAPPGISVVSSQAGADAMFYGASSDGAADRTFNAAAASNATAKLFGPSALDNDTFASALTPAAQSRTFVSAPGFLPKNLTPAGKKFVADFIAAYHHAPRPEAIFGYEAMSSVVAVLREAGSTADNRSTVVHDFFSIKNRDSVLGSYSINVNGDTSLGPFVFSRFEHSKLTPFRFVQVQG